MAEGEQRGLDDGMLVEAVKKYELLFNKRHKFYRNNTLREKIWAELSRTLNLPKSDLKERWRYLRERYVREKRKENLPSGSQGGYSSCWHLQEALRFLDDHIIHRSTVSNMQETQEDQNSILENLAAGGDLGDGNGSDEESALFTSKIIDSPSENTSTNMESPLADISNTLVNPPQKTRKRKNTETLDPVEKLLVEHFGKKNSKPPSEIKIFCGMMASMLESMEEKTAHLLMKKMHDMVYEAKYGE